MKATNHLQRWQPVESALKDQDPTDAKQRSPDAIRADLQQGLYLAVAHPHALLLCEREFLVYNPDDRCDRGAKRTSREYLPGFQARGRPLFCLHGDFGFCRLSGGMARDREKSARDCSPSLVRPEFSMVGVADIVGARNRRTGDEHVFRDLSL